MYDVAVIGAGTGGLTVARLTAQAGQRVALIERDRPGGDCLWTGCVPTKALIHAAQRAHDVRESARFGVTHNGAGIDFSVIRRHMGDAQHQAGRAESDDRIASWGVDLIRGEAHFVDAQRVKVDGRTLTARSFVIATGSHPVAPSIPGLQEAPFETNVELLAWDELPASLAILGAGPIGVEFAQAMSRLSVQVTLIEQAPRVLEREDAEASRIIATVLKREGVKVLANARVGEVSHAGQQIQLQVDHDGDQRAVVAERLVVATGRAPSIGTLNLEAAGVEVSSQRLTVDAYLRTSQPHVYAVGDVAGGAQFTHVAEDQGRTVAGNLLRRGRFSRPSKWNGRVVPRVTFSDPEVAAVGLTSQEARRRHRGVREWTVPLDAVDRAITTGATDGFIRLVTARGWQSRIPGLSRHLGDEIVGATIVAPSAGELLMPIVMAMRAHLPAGVVAWNMQAYPTLSLGVRQAAGRMFDPGA